MKLYPTMAHTINETELLLRLPLAAVGIRPVLTELSEMAKRQAAFVRRGDASDGTHWDGVSARIAECARDVATLLGEPRKTDKPAEKTEVRHLNAIDWANIETVKIGG